MNPFTVRVRRPVTAVVSAVLFGVVALAAGAPSRAAPGPVPDPASAAGAVPAATTGCTDTTGKPYASGLPALPCLQNPFSKGTLYQDFGLAVSSTQQQVSKPKVRFSFPPIVARAFTVLCSTTFTAAYPACPFPPGFSFPKPDPKVTNGYYGPFSDVYFQSPSGSNPQYGSFPPVKVAVLSFGSIPVTATVTVTQATDANGGVTPLKLGWFTSSGFVTKGKVIPGYEEYGPAPAPPPGDQVFFAPKPVVTGPITITVSDVAVDGVALDVGTTCHADTQLSLTANDSFYASKAQPVKGAVQTPGVLGPPEYLPLSNYDNFLHGDVDIPAFSGCRNGTEDVSPLLTGIVSGPDNPVDVTQKGALQPFGCFVTPVAACGTHPPTTYGR